VIQDFFFDTINISEQDAYKCDMLDNFAVQVFVSYAGKAIPVTDHEDAYGFETSRLTGGGEVVSLTRRPPFTPQEEPCYSFLLEAEAT
jgi:hypothetical protein